jgi:hypothetical protein
MFYEAIYVDDTVLWDPVKGISETFSGAQVAFCKPGETITLFPRRDRLQVDSMKIEAQLLELAAPRVAFSKIALAIAIVILVGVAAAAIQLFNK